jgi:hypothetical protein
MFVQRAFWLGQLDRKSPDRFHATDFRWSCDTVGQMLENNLEVVGKCASCGLVMLVDLRMVARVRGPKFSLWNRKTRCKRLHCHGHMALMARWPGVSFHQELVADDGTLPPPVGR